MDYNLIIKHLSSVELKKENFNRVKILINKLESFGSMLYFLNPGDSVHRARPHSENQIFRFPQELSYKPQALNNTFQRASTPNRTAFYGCLGLTKRSYGQTELARITGSVESISWIRDIETTGYQKVTFGKWIVKEKIELMTVLDGSLWQNSSCNFQKMIHDLDSQLDLNPTLKSKTIEILKFFAGEFSKDKINSHEDYLLSAIFAEVIMDSGAEGILYPSVRTFGEGLNVAIHPDVADEKLELQLIGECSIYKKREKLIIGFDKLITSDENKLFNTEVLIPNNPSQDECLRFIGAVNLDELIISSTQ
jgi:hypothetical protein